MASPVIKIRRSAVEGNAPTAAQLELGELALNTYDGKLFTEINDGTVSIVEIGGHLQHLAATGISTFGSDKVVVGAAQTQFLVRGNGRVVGVLTVGSGSVTLNDDSVNVGAGTTILTTGFQIGGGGVFVHSTGYNVGNTFVHNAGITGAGANLSGVVTCTNISMVNTDAGSSAGPILDLYRNSSSAADADYMGQIKFQGENDADQKIVYAKITGKIQDASDGTEDGLIEFANKKAGSNVITARLRSDSFQLLNSTNLSVAGDTTLTGGLDVDGHTEIDNLKSVGIATFSSNAIHANVYSTGISTISGFRFPTSDGDEDQALVTDGNGSLSFKTLSGGGGGATGAATTISAGITTATQGQTVFSTPHPHNDGTNTYSTQVFVNGVKQRPQGAGNATKDYTTSSNSTITFEEGLKVGDEVVSTVYFGHTIDEEYFTATQGQVLFPLTGSLSAQKNFRVFVNGIKQRVGSDFGVAAPVSLVVPCAEGAHVEIVCDNAEDAFVATDQQTNFTPTSTDITEDNMQVYVNGIQLFSGIDYSIGSPSVTFTDASGLTVGDEVDVCIRRTA